MASKFNELEAGISGARAACASRSTGERAIRHKPQNNEVLDDVINTTERLKPATDSLKIPVPRMYKKNKIDALIEGVKPAAIGELSEKLFLTHFKIPRKTPDTLKNPDDKPVAPKQVSSARIPERSKTVLPYVKPCKEIIIISPHKLPRRQTLNGGSTKYSTSSLQPDADTLGNIVKARLEAAKRVVGATPVVRRKRAILEVSNDDDVVDIRKNSVLKPNPASQFFRKNKIDDLVTSQQELKQEKKMQVEPLTSASKNQAAAVVLTIESDKNVSKKVLFLEDIPMIFPSKKQLNKKRKPVDDFTQNSENKKQKVGNLLGD